MKDWLELVGNGAGILGVLACLVAGVTRLVGSYTLISIEAMTLFTVGIGLMVVACLAKIHRLGMKS